jgi:hypothetical protein
MKRKVNGLQFKAQVARQKAVNSTKCVFRQTPHGVRTTVDFLSTTSQGTAMNERQPMERKRDGQRAGR